MATSTFIKKRTTLQNNVMVLADVTLGVYSTNGVAVTPANFGLTRIDHLVCGSPPVGGVVASYVPSTGLIKTWNSSTGAPVLLVETANGVDLSAAVVPCIVFGE